MSDDRPVPRSTRLERWWAHVIDVGLTLWVLRAPVVGIFIGLLLLWLVPQAQDLLVELCTAGWGRILVFFALLSFVWALPTHYCARLLVNTDEGYQQRIAARKTAFLFGLQRWIPRVLGGLTFVAMIGAVWRSWLNLPDISDRTYAAHVAWCLAWVALALLILLAAFWLYAIYRETLAGVERIRRWEAFAARPMHLLRRFVPPITNQANVNATDSDLGRLLLLLMFAIFAVLPLFTPLIFAELFPRASSVPFVLGGWMPLLTYLAALGRRLHAPLITFALALSAILPLVFGDSYEVRRIDAAREIMQLTGLQAADASQITAPLRLEDAVRLWKLANSCADEGDTCPRPIIVAAAGGASRAGLFTAGAIGQIFDDQLRIGGRGHGLTPEEISRRLFAFSAVSGSALGAVMTVGALAASADGMKPPCATNESLWHGERSGSPTNDWRSCLEALMSGDFLTPVFVGFVFRDTLRFLGFAGWSDRGTLLERSWEDHFGRLLGKARSRGALACVGSLGCPFRTLRPFATRWLPLLVLNGTSVSTGQRIVTTVLDRAYNVRSPQTCPERPGASRCPIFADHFDFHSELLDNEAPAGGWRAWLQRRLGFSPSRRDDRRDVRLSTAAHNSARFPLISPPGEVRNRVNNIVDRIVDGGYFENFGAQSAVELARAVRTVDRRLTPFVLILSNDPEIPAEDESRIPDAPEGEFLTDVSGPVQALLHTRGARGTLAVDHVATSLGEFLGLDCGPNTAHIRVWPEYIAGGAKSQKSSEKKEVRPLSMSWWLSKPVQIYLHEQTTNELNRQGVVSLLDAFKSPICAARPVSPAPRRERSAH